MKISKVAIITARGGSKRIPRKNIRSFQGRPILHYSIEAAIKTGTFDEVMVSTDDDEIAEVALAGGAKVPFRRSAKNSDDYASTADVIREVIDTYQGRGISFDRFCCMYPTAPFVTAEKLQRAIAMLENGTADSILPVVAFSFPIQRAYKIESGFIELTEPQYFNSRSQDLPPRYHDCGQFVYSKTEAFLRTGRVMGARAIPLIVPESEVQDIDNEEDWKIAELKYQLMVEGRA